MGGTALCGGVEQFSGQWASNRGGEFELRHPPGVSVILAAVRLLRRTAGTDPEKGCLDFGTEDPREWGEGGQVYPVHGTSSTPPLFYGGVLEALGSC